MEGHEPSDWSTYYAEPEVGTRPLQKWGGCVRSFPNLRTASLACTRLPPLAALSSRLFHPPSTEMGLFFIRHTVSLEIILTL